MTKPSRTSFRLQAPTAGFTLVEIMITVAIIGILSAVALPIYQDYVLQGRLVDATNALSSLRVRMEQYYQDNRTYLSTSTTTSPCASSSDAGLFTITCPTLTATTWIAQAQGSKQVASFKYTINQDGTMATTGLPTKWGSPANGCWIIHKGGTC